MRNYLKLLALPLCFTALVSTAVTPSLEKKHQADANHWADSVYNTLSERQRVAQLIFPGVVPTNGEKTKATLHRYISEDGCGGILFSEGSIAQYSEMINYAQSQSSVPVMITFDGEWGLAMRIREETPRYPHNMGLGAITDYRLLYDYGAEMARECRAIGVHVNFAPVADVNTNPANPVIGYRAFGEDPERVAKATVAYSLGLEDNGVQSVSKHFPGHGDTDVDSHKALTSVNHSRELLEAADLVPFKEYIEAGCSGVMVGHISVHSLDPTDQPASLSPVITSDLLRKEMGFEGLVYTDALGMKGATDKAGRNNALASLIAGADVLLSSRNPKADIDAIMAAIDAGTVSKSVIEDRCKRVLRYKYLFCKDNTSVDTDIQRLYNTINSAEAASLMQRLADASITVLKNDKDLLPIGDLSGKRVTVVNIGEKADNAFTNTCRHYVSVGAHFTKGENFSATTLAKINANDVIVTAVYNDSEASRSCLAQVVREAKKPVVAVFFVNPYKMKKFEASLKNVAGLVLAYDDVEALRVSAGEALFGGIETSGRLPVNLKGLAKVGDGITLKKSRLGFAHPVSKGFSPWLADSLDALINKGIEVGAFPGCQLVVAKGGDIIYDGAFGHLSTSAGSKAVNKQTAYDLASVSKATGTLSGIMKAYDQGLLNLDATLGQLIPEITDSAKQTITVRELLFHETGMPASLNVFDAVMDKDTYTGPLTTTRRDSDHNILIQKGLYGHDRARLRTDILGTHKSEKFPVEASKGIFTGKITYDTLMHRIYNIPLRKNKSYNYSCLNFCLLMDIEQRLTGRSHDEYVGTEIFGPLGAYRTGYRPHTSIGADNVASTEKDTYLRRQTLTGYVHDELANFSGGLQGNAGLFANAEDIAKLCQMLLNGGTYGDKRILSEETAHRFTTETSPTCRRGLGYDKPDKENPDNSPTCDEAPASVFGHLGFTGTVFWVDPENEIVFVFLNNRVNPTRDNAAFSKLNIRPKLFSLVYRALEK
ncbi:MAG: serine hydrolase [Muribaculaceae bacterium]|nr:serine hydrolase [Muribaculaceae bacterium]